MRGLGGLTWVLKEFSDALGKTTTKVHAINPGDQLTF